MTYHLTDQEERGHVEYMVAGGPHVGGSSYFAPFIGETNVAEQIASLSHKGLVRIKYTTKNAIPYAVIDEYRQ